MMVFEVVTYLGGSALLDTKSFTSPFDLFKGAILRKYPEISNLRVEPWSDNIEPIKYDSGDYGIKHEHPPQVTWRVGNTRFFWAPRPSFKRETWSIFIFSGSTVKPTYDQSDCFDDLLELIEISVKPEKERHILMREFNARPLKKSEFEF